MSIKTPIEVATCTSCDLYKNSKINCQKGRGLTASDLMFVGEAPGELEEDQNEAFVGPAGEVFERLLWEVKLTKEAVYATNQVKCRPTNLAKSKRDRDGNIHYDNLTPTTQQSYICASKHLEDEIKIVHPKVIVPMGNVACDYLFGKYELLPDNTIKISQKTGKPAVIRPMPTITDLLYSEYWDAQRQCWLVPIFHPSYIMRNPAIFTMMVAILNKAIKISKDGPGKDVTEWFAATSFDDALSVLRRAKEHKVISYDHETAGLDWRFGPLLNTGLSWKEGTGASIRWVDNNGVSLYTPDQRNTLVEEAKNIFQNPEKLLVGYNVPFDSNWTRAKLGLRVTTPQRDVQSIYHTLSPWVTYKNQSLEKLAWLYTDMANFKGATAPWFAKKKFLECPIPVMSQRNCGDVDSTLRLYNRFYPQLETQPVFPHYKNCLEHLTEMSTLLNWNGATVSLAKLKLMKERLEIASTELSNQFCAEVNVPLFNLRSGPQLIKVLFEHMKLPVLERTEKTGRPKTSDYILQELSKKTPLLKSLMEYRKLQKLLGTYVLGLRGCALFGNSKKRKPDIWTVEEAWHEGFETDGKVHPSFAVPTGTVTGRPSVSNPNIANQPRPTEHQKRLGVVLRQVFEAPEGASILEADQSQSELRVLAALSGDDVLTEAINSKEGVHRRTAVMLFHIPLEKVGDDEKSSAKTIVFAIGYGGTAWTVEENIPDELDKEIIRRRALTGDSTPPTREDRLALAEELILAWRNLYPKSFRWIEEQKNFLHQNGYVVSVFGRVYYFPLVHTTSWKLKGECERAAVNYLIQGPSSDVTFMAGIRIQKEIERLGFESRISNMVYDALFYEVPDSELEAMKILVKTEMERPVPGINMNFVAEIEVGRCWKEDHEESPLDKDPLAQAEDDADEEAEDE